MCEYSKQHIPCGARLEDGRPAPLPVRRGQAISWQDRGRFRGTAPNLIQFNKILTIQRKPWISDGLVELP